MSNEALVRAVRNGCADSFGELVDRCAPGLLAFLHHRTGSVEDAEDLVQDTFVRSYLKLNQFDDRHKFTTWLYTIARNLAAGRSGRRISFRINTEPISPHPGPEHILDMMQLRTSLWSVARTLPRNQYEVLWLRYSQDMSVKDIAGVVSRSPVSVKVMLHRARINMAKKLSRRRRAIADSDGFDTKTSDSYHESSGA